MVKKGEALDRAAEGLVEEISREDYEKILTRKNKPDATQKEPQQMSLPLDQPDPVPDVGGPFPAQDPQIPKALCDLMEMNHVDEWELQNVVAARGYYPSDVPIRDYDTEFINGCLIGAWDQVHSLVKEMRKKQEIPFNN